MTWKASDGTVLASGKTNSNGRYELLSKYPLEMTNHNYSGPTTSSYNRYNGSYVEFKYNGLKYITAVTNTGITNGSKAKEDTSSRTALDEKFDEVTSKGVLDNGRVAYGLSFTRGGNYTSALNQDNNDFAVTATTKLAGMSISLDDAREVKHTFCTNHCTGNGTHIVDYTEPESEDEEAEPIYCSSAHCPSESKYTDEWHIENINLGLVLKEQVSVGITSDIEKVDVIMKGQQYTYKYNYKEQLTEAQLYDYKVKFQDKNIPTQYRRPVNPADIAYVNNNGVISDDLQVYVTYKMRVKNRSNTLTLRVNEIINYYDEGYELYNSPGWSNKSKYNHNYNENNGFEGAYYQLNKKLEPQTESETIYIKFKVSAETIDGLLSNDAPLNNVSEIYSYTSFYGSDTLCSEKKLASSAGKTGKQYSSIDDISLPGNAEPDNAYTFENDTDEAPTFLLEKDRDENGNIEYKTISGTVWEDSPTAESLNMNERLGNGKKDNSDRPVQNVRVELCSVIGEEADGTLIVELANLYQIDEAGQKHVKPAITFTDSNGNYILGGNGWGVAADNYVVRYIYGDHVAENADGSSVGTTIPGTNTYINARDYKSTIVTYDLIKNLINEAYPDGDWRNEEWHLIAEENYSTAVDHIKERKQIQTLKYDNFEDTVTMTAYTKPFKIQVEYLLDKEMQVSLDGETRYDRLGGNVLGGFEHNCNIFDFAIIEKPREDLVVETQISKLKIVLADGQILAEGDPYEETLQYVKAIGTTKRTTEAEAQNAKNKLISIEMDQELIQGARIEMVYTTTVYNNSEYDYEYDSDLGGNTNYYYFGNRQGAKKKTNYVQQLLNYVDAELVFNEDETVNKSWKKISAQSLYDNGFIPESTYGIVKDNYVMYTTDKFNDILPGDYHREQILVSKLLANQATAYTYENHTEIIELNRDTARTIDKTENGKQIEKLYKVGNYVPSLTNKSYNTTNILSAMVRQQDDDRIIIKITPPTGLLENIMVYISVITIGLVAIVVGIIFIKKRIL